MLCLFYLLNTLNGLSLVYTHSTLNTISPFLQRCVIIVEPCLKNVVYLVRKQQNIYAKWNAIKIYNLFISSLHWWRFNYIFYKCILPVEVVHMDNADNVDADCYLNV
ncbi:hypothetical protein T4B_14125 [Trichinella pseudospiralis]|uniref:Secreted protein n=1 Tax=Trichinella pseudospiralis TaxID=6337 RepID=A0A0V1JAD4_TRIPS|nr:hypothetical protein T4B_14125 [Trichinella pseudospiralis]